MKHMKSDLNYVRAVRAHNNGLWMAILEIALTHAPEETKKVLRTINDNDAKITDTLHKLAQ